MSSLADRAGPLVFVAATVVLQLLAAFVLDVAASASAIGIAALGAVAIAIGLHGVRFMLWGHVHKHYPLSHSYPLTALFFPFVLVISHLRGDHVDWYQLVGTLVITLGVGLMAMDGAKHGATE